MVDLRLDSYIYKQQPTLSRSSYSHVDNEGVKALVDSICTRWCTLENGEAAALTASSMQHAATDAGPCGASCIRLWPGVAYYYYIPSPAERHALCPPSPNTLPRRPGAGHAAVHSCLLVARMQSGAGCRLPCTH